MFVTMFCAKQCREKTDAKINAVCCERQTKSDVFKSHRRL